MKKLIYLLLFAFIASSTFISCDDDEDVSPIKTATIGAQENTTIGGFYSISDQKVYSLEQAASKQETIDFLCFYEEKNEISISSPGANIKDIFIGDNAPENWTTTDTTRFYQLESSVFTVTQFDALTENDAIIESLYNADEARRKAKLLQVDDIYVFQTEDNYYGLFKVISVVQGATGSVEIEYIIKK